MVAPAPVRQAELARTLGQVLRRPTGLPMPAWVVRLLFGEMGTTLLLRDCAVRPTRLQAAGFSWQTPELGAALRHELAVLNQK
jgi:NAD dependent epimerase/dehydratase family enzyme